MIDDDLYIVLESPVKEAALSSFYNWNGLLDAGEIENELWIQIMESPATAVKLRNSDERLVKDLLRRMSERICISERDAYDYFSGNYQYSVNEVKAIAALALRREITDSRVEYIDFDKAFAVLEKKNPTYAEEVVHKCLGTGPSDGGNTRTRAFVKLTNEMNRGFRNRQQEHRDSGKRRSPA